MSITNYYINNFIGIVLISTVQPVIFSERPSFYREKFINLYDIKLYTLANTLVEIPYLIVSSILFLIPYFYIIKFDKNGITVDHFFFYWVFIGLHMSSIVFLGHLIASSVQNEGIGNICTGTIVIIMMMFMLLMM